MPIRSQIITLQPNVFYQNYCNQHMHVVTFYAQIYCNLCMCMCVVTFYAQISCNLCMCMCVRVCIFHSLQKKEKLTMEELQ